MARFHPLTVTDVRKTIRDAVVVTLRPEEGDFDFTQGQYLTFRRDFDGTEIRRSYSICVGRGSKDLQVGIKKVVGGAFSTWANEDLRPGDILEAMEPQGRFHVPLEPDRARHYLCFAGGSGITPVLSIIRTVLAEEPRSQVTLIYANRGAPTIMFREELEDLKNLYLGRLSLIHVLEEGQEIELFQGRVDGAKCNALFERWVDIGSVDTAFICGPEPMMLAIAEALKAHGLPEDRIKYELFASGQPGRLERPAISADEAEAETRLAVTLDGTTQAFETRRDRTVLEAALEQSIDAPYSCRAGVCSTCKCRVIEGEVEMIANHALEDDEVAKGFVLSCQSFPVTDRVAVDYDQH
ncbi:2Fe-2S iron-sulfur cluster-binding protein [Jannaschia aquimarina]|uniref:PaaE protein n=1 Tax=Jannaschia aquimarina TaxID=935700 RepID=A0A0D1CPV2_9RHOB|nr:2Fe-2S iron-sulfur cluster-binding protein [Jannaschia aquimarina]KIT16777.1 1,2-phenylacetyl-CoA epoxidase, subunit E [Jannaschia aquimarina]SNS52622.1 ring-1,2-phenylacetyl-CoA epoxidase subunit PaaE [Jannaschia aquimarina]